VLTAVAVLDSEAGRWREGVERTVVHVGRLEEAWIEAYVRTGEPLDKAGAYAAQGLFSVFVERVEGCYSNVVGLPLALLGKLLASLGFSVTDVWQTAAMGAGGQDDVQGHADQGAAG
jgi:septum formation protein